MKFFTSVGALAALISIVSAAPQVGQNFGLIVIRSGSAVQNSGVRVSGDDLVVASQGDYFEGQFTSDGKIAYGDRFLAIKDGELVVDDEGDSEFSTTDSDGLTYQGTESFVAHPEDDHYNILFNTGTVASTDLGVRLRVFYSTTSSSEPSVTSAANNTTATTPVTTSAPETSAEGNATVTVTSCGTAGCVQPTASIPQVNGAFQTAVGLGAAIVGAAGALFL